MQNSVFKAFVYQIPTSWLNSSSLAPARSDRVTCAKITAQIEMHLGGTSQTQSCRALELRFSNATTCLGMSGDLSPSKFHLVLMPINSLECGP